MHCPKCGQSQAAEETRFCSRCGFLLTGVARVVSQGGILSDDRKAVTPRNQGLKQGLFIFMLSFLVVPIIAILTIAANAEPFAVVLSLILLTVGGLLRAAYALMFQSNEPHSDSRSRGDAFDAPNYLTGTGSPAALRPQQSVPAASYAAPVGKWRDTNDLEGQPSSVTDSTTKLLKNESEDQ